MCTVCLIFLATPPSLWGALPANFPFSNIVCLRGACRRDPRGACPKKFAFSNITCPSVFTAASPPLHYCRPVTSHLWTGHSLLADDISGIVVYGATSDLACRQGYDQQDGIKWYDDDIKRIHLPSLTGVCHHQQ